ncbi:hypothetical protein [Legionella shakespearei]|uniref:Uncharacterized protein n=1 Tax=Legionella shakespearei DSM 23087 TaxID=1122169 RepID=A0A0W0Z7F8_9GAMM|nr:hypothetical protein [Legionella shakespearei]KTD65050.1 hypothetical protein Lsha_0419 [Legionella shakespearei DSM 23087]
MKPGVSEKNQQEKNQATHKFDVQAFNAEIQEKLAPFTVSHAHSNIFMDTFLRWLGLEFMASSFEMKPIPNKEGHFCLHYKRTFLPCQDVEIERRINEKLGAGAAEIFEKDPIFYIQKRQLHMMPTLVPEALLNEADADNQEHERRFWQEMEKLRLRNAGDKSIILSSLIAHGELHINYSLFRQAFFDEHFTTEVERLIADEPGLYDYYQRCSEAQRNVPGHEEATELRRGIENISGRYGIHFTSNFMICLLLEHAGYSQWFDHTLGELSAFAGERCTIESDQCFQTKSADDLQPVLAKINELFPGLARIRKQDSDKQTVTVGFNVFCFKEKVLPVVETLFAEKVNDHEWLEWMQHRDIWYRKADKETPAYLVRKFYIQCMQDLQRGAEQGLAVDMLLTFYQGMLDKLAPYAHTVRQQDVEAFHQANAQLNASLLKDPQRLSFFKEHMEKSISSTERILECQIKANPWSPH